MKFVLLETRLNKILGQKDSFKVEFGYEVMTEISWIIYRLTQNRNGFWSSRAWLDFFSPIFQKTLTQTGENPYLISANLREVLENI